MSIMKLFGMGNASKLSTAELWPDESERYYGLENFGNTCYCNSILQALYFCKPFRDCVTNYPYGPIPNLLKESNGEQEARNSLSSNTAEPCNQRSASGSNGIVEAATNASRDVNGQYNQPATNGQVEDTVVNQRRPEIMDNSLFSELQNLFWKINQQKRQSGVMAPNQFINKVRKENELFRGTMHQDAHEFLIYILNTVAENVMDYEKKCFEQHQEKHPSTITTNGINGHVNGKSELLKGWSEYFEDTSTTITKDSSNNETQSNVTSSTTTTATPPTTTWVHRLFEGVLTNETKCLTCETVTSRDECFLDLSIDIEQHSSVTSCLRQFSTSEMLCHKNKFFCDSCCALQEAEKRMKIKRLPKVLALHLKRFKYQERVQRYIKLSYRVVFPMELRLFDTCDSTENPDCLYTLFAIVVHIGGGPHHGHYVCIIKSAEQWLLFDDDCVQIISEDDIPRYFGGLTQNGSGYLLFYQVADEDKLAHV
ncbi:hypothetical protein BDF19DRAFT_448916 [Syncephalis fuscata]|nr:hypothetical protein BDF19DRAFT_448916 [Syncephalis fuscata]